MDGYADMPGFCKSISLEEVEELEERNIVLPPSRAVSQEDDGAPFEDRLKLKRLVAQLREQQAESARLDAVIAESLNALGFESPE